MIMVTAKVTVIAENRNACLKLCALQVENSRLEAGCLEYGFYEDAMAPGTFIFVERWRDQAALDFHFAQRYCLDFIRAVRKLSRAASPIEIYHVTKTTTPS